VLSAEGADLQPTTDRDLSIKTVLGANDVTKGSEGYAATGSDVEY